MSAVPAQTQQVDGEFDSFYTVEMAKVSGFLMNLGASPYEAADAAHDAFLKLLPDRWKSLDHPGAYLRKTAYRNYLRQANSRTHPADPVPDRTGGTCPIELVVLTEQQQKMLGLLSTLPPAEREAMAWSLDGFNHEEIAKILGKNPAAVRQAYKRARSRLIDALGLKKEATTGE
ncbi:sigma-70 family RNA polymerase sigma factor (plasmid) [Streptomyces xanthophaeus]|uniref:RNA polymerase sigma factor n=1 Tax=Streptomyces xanthophaeus TaxID=67385 RepID=UPI002F9068EC|nr:sigma-70 family RNA polymerase sigma factor [Streptomyces xanthophaeus]WST27634.1 sigma-70 family RNA polymerase sigma factor [Streptomyces xanthophaeus]WST65998.1 sigma-70 family RNA polymerase sigma factor [Streptomyces xanthophaeus]WST66026.1 sigma-70 family RNA polymerase sigma factor [Streptomyces xanthophaeus]